MVKSDKQSEHLVKARQKAAEVKKLNAKIRNLQNLAHDDSIDEDTKNILLQKAQDEYDKYFRPFKGKVVETKILFTDEQPKPPNKQPNSNNTENEELKQQIEELKSIVLNLSINNNKPDTKNKLPEQEPEDLDDDEDDLLDEVEDYKEELEEDFIDMLDEDERDVFELLNELHELEIRLIREEYEDKIFKLEHAENLKEYRHQKMLSAIQDRAKAIYADKMKNNDDIQKTVQEKLRWYGDFTDNREGFEKYRQKVIDDEIHKRIKI